MFDINLLIRKNIRSLVPYSSARDEYKGEDAVFLDANENPFNTSLEPVSRSTSAETEKNNLRH